MTDFTPEKRQKFLSKLAEMPNVARAARLCGITKQTAYRHRAIDEEFAVAWEEALDEGVERLEEEAMKRAKKYSDVLMIFLLKAHRPEKYRDNLNLSGTLNVKGYQSVNPDDWDEEPRPES